MRLLQRQRRGRRTPIIGCLSHSSMRRRFYTACLGGPPAAPADATIFPAVSPRAPAVLPLLLADKCPAAAALLDTRRIASDLLLPPLLRPRSCTATTIAATHSRALVPHPRNLRLRSFHSRPRLPSLPRDDLHSAARQRRTRSAMAQPEWTGVRVRETFFDYFSKKGHTVVPSSSVVPHNDPTLRE